MKPEAILQARERLEWARAALARMEAAGDATGEDWAAFLVAAGAVYMKLEAGSRRSASARAWFAAAVDRRKSDPLLRFIWLARNDDMHGLNTSIEVLPVVTFTFSGVFENIHIDPNSKVHILGQADGPVVGESRHAFLMPVVDRKNRCDPPEEHLGQDLWDNSPTGVAAAAVAYLSKLVLAAETLSPVP